MKNKLFTLLLAAASVYGTAQTTIATFETGETPAATITGAVADGEQQEFTMGVDNPLKAGINTSDKVLYVLTNQVVTETSDAAGRPRWNKNVVSIKFDQTETITDQNRYLHIMQMRETMLSGTWLVFGENGDSSFVELARGTAPEAGAWFDMVIDVKAKLNTLRGINIVLEGNWGGGSERFYAPTKFYYDNIVLNNDKNPTGVSDITRQNLLDFEDSALTNATVSSVVQNANYVVDLNYTNPTMAGANNSSKCAYFMNPVAWVWWHGLNLNMKAPVDASGYKYLHIMMRKSVAETSDVVVNLVTSDGAQSANMMYNPISTDWVDYVMEIPATHKNFTGMFIKLNAGVNTECFVDEIYMDNDATPRTTVTTGTATTDMTAHLVRVEKETIYLESNNEMAVKIYNIAGQLLHSQVATDVVYPAQKGIYIVSVNGKASKVLVP